MSKTSLFSLEAHCLRYLFIVTESWLSQIAVFLSHSKDGAAGLVWWIGWWLRTSHVFPQVLTMVNRKLRPVWGKQGKGIHQRLISNDGHIEVPGRQLGGEGLMTEDRHGQSFQRVSVPRGAEKWGWASQGKLLLFCFASIGTNICRVVCKPRMSMVTNENGGRGDARQGGLSKTFKAIEFWLEQQGTVGSLSRAVWQEKNHILKRTSCLKKQPSKTKQNKKAMDWKRAQIGAGEILNMCLGMW